jgi:beta-N-acetylhexosaminidase
MPDFELLRKNPFFLNDVQIQWVKSTIASMTKEEKVGQLFCMPAYSVDEQQLNEMIDKYKLGSMMGRTMTSAEVLDFSRIVQTRSKIPLLLAANFEAGGDGLVTDGTNVGPNLQIGATNDPEFAAKQGYVSAREGGAVGANWAFAPVIDIDHNWRNPIMGTRLYSSNKELVKNCGVAYTKACQSNGMAVSIKHFPGDGCDERDQHLVTSINSLSCEDWDSSYGEAYKASIEAGALTVMVGHIMQPAYQRYFKPDTKDEDLMPATLCPELLNGLLRGKLGFNGMIVTDATPMAGFQIPMDRRKSVPYAIAAGNDMFLFANNLEEDYEFMLKGVDDGVITPERLDEALMRILGVKAALKLPEKKANGTLIPSKEETAKIVGCPEHKQIEKDCADCSVTLVKNLDNIFPLDVAKYRRILLYPMADGRGFGGKEEELASFMKEKLEKEGFTVDVFTPPIGREGVQKKYQEMIDSYDLLLYVCNLATYSNKTVQRISWALPMGSNCPYYIKVIPTIFISFASPYHLIDVPRIRTFINAYKFKEATVDAVIDKMLGRSDFKGKNPVDPFCGRWDTKI